MPARSKSALIMPDGAKVKNDLEELREHFDLDAVLGYYHDGSLLDWLETRYYDEEAEQLEELDAEDENLAPKLCRILGVEYVPPEFDEEDMARMKEKKVILETMTDDEEIISHYRETAFNQSDLATLLDVDEPVIYLCGEKFRIPARVENKKYIGLFSKPEIQISAKTFGDLEKKHISFENVVLPHVFYENEQKEYVLEAFQKYIAKDAGTWSKIHLSSEWDSKLRKKGRQYAREYFHNILESGITIKYLTVEEKITSENMKKMALKSVCGDVCTLKDVLGGLLVGEESTLHGYVITWDSLCIGGAGWGKVIIKYKDIESIHKASYQKREFSEAIVIKLKGGNEYDGTGNNWLQDVYNPDSLDVKPYYENKKKKYVLLAASDKVAFSNDKIVPFLMMVWRSLSE